MKILIYEPNGQLQKFLTSYMLRSKLTPVIIERVGLLYQTLQTCDYEILLADYSTEESVINDTIFNLKLDPKLNFIKVFITTPKPERSVLQTLIQLGISGFIKKPFTSEQFQQVFSGWMQKNSFCANKRIHTRIRPVPSDNAYLFMKLEGFLQEIPSEIVDISAGGVAVLLPRSFERLMDKCFTIGMPIKNLRMKIRQAMVRINFEVITWVGTRLSLKFVDIEEATSRYILHYVADNLQ